MGAVVFKNLVLVLVVVLACMYEHAIQSDGAGCELKRQACFVLLPFLGFVGFFSYRPMTMWCMDVAYICYVGWSVSRVLAWETDKLLLASGMRVCIRAVISVLYMDKRVSFR